VAIVPLGYDANGRPFPVPAGNRLVDAAGNPLAESAGGGSLLNVGFKASVSPPPPVPGSPLTLGFNTEVYDTHGFHDNVTNNHRFTIPGGQDGYYLLSVTAYCDPTPISTYHSTLIEVYSPGPTLLFTVGTVEVQPVAGPPLMNLVLPLYATAGMWVQLTVEHDGLFGVVGSFTITGERLA
jgi:hypothetical protein